MNQDYKKVTLRVGLIGDYNTEVKAHIAIPKALELASIVTGCEVKANWIATKALKQNAEQLSSFDALWCVPGSPYVNMDGALLAIRFARESGLPFLGTCGGFQHALIEYARNVLGLTDADHAESNPKAAVLLVAPLSCSLVGEKGTIKLKEGSRIHHIYGKDEVVEQYHCNYGFNPHYESLLESGDIKVTGIDNAGEIRVIELTNHPFFIATLFQPELSALSGVAHPLISAYVEAAASFHTQRNKAQEQTAG